MSSNNNNNLNTNLKNFFYKIDKEKNYIYVVKGSELRKEKNKNYEIINQYIINNLKLCPENNQFYVILDLYQLKRKNLKISHLMNLTKLLSITFPDKLKKCYIMNFPIFFQTIYKIISPLIDKITRKKIIFCDKDNFYPKFNIQLIANSISP